MKKSGKLYLIPTPLGENTVHTIPEYVIKIIHSLDIFIAERAKTARHFIKETQFPTPISDLTIFELNKHSDKDEVSSYLDSALDGKNIGLMSEAGCPGVADPGAVIVQMAHQMGVEVIPLVGPSSILLALMASGLNGQHFVFHGYLSNKGPQLQKDLKRLEKNSYQNNQAQIFIETPYRNKSLIENVLKTLSPKTLFCIACDISTANQYIATKTIRDWKKEKLPDFHKRPAIFLIGQQIVL